MTKEEMQLKVQYIIGAMNLNREQKISIAELFNDVYDRTEVIESNEPTVVIEELQSSATLADVVKKVNEIILAMKTENIII